MSARPHGPPKSKRFRPRPLRQLVYVLAVIAAILVGYGIVLLLAPAPEPHGGGQAPVQRSEPWYRTQAPPPSMVTLADAPIFPEPIEGQEGETLRAYEEALPREIFVPTAPPAKATSKRPAPKTTPAPVAAATGSGQPETEEEGEPAWLRHALASLPPDGRPRIAIVIDDLGVDKKRTAQIMALEGPLTLSFLTYATDLDAQTRAARGAGHELLLHVPMEPEGEAIDPGPHVLRGSEDLEAARRSLRWGFERFSGFVGLNNHMGSRFTADAAGMAVVMEELRSRGLLFLDSRTSPNSVGGALARAMGVPFAERNIFLDNDNDVAAVAARLKETERFARSHAVAIAIGHPRDATIEALSRWLPAARARGFALVPLTNVVRYGDGG